MRSHTAVVNYYKDFELTVKVKLGVLSPLSTTSHREQWLNVPCEATVLSIYLGFQDGDPMAVGPSPENVGLKRAVPVNVLVFRYKFQPP